MRSRPLRLQLLLATGIVRIARAGARRVAGSPAGRAVTGAVLPRRVHAARAAGRDRLPEQGNSLRDLVADRGRDATHDRRRPEAPRRRDRRRRRAPHLGPEPAPSSPYPFASCPAAARRSTALVSAGAADSKEFQDLISDTERLRPIAEATGGLGAASAPMRPEASICRPWSAFRAPRRRPGPISSGFARAGPMWSRGSRSGRSCLASRPRPACAAPHSGLVLRGKGLREGAGADLKQIKAKSLTRARVWSRFDFVLIRRADCPTRVLHRFVLLESGYHGLDLLAGSMAVETSVATSST